MTDKHTNIIPPAINTPFFEDTEIRRERYNDERWYSIVNIISVLTWSSQANRYWSELKKQLSEKEWYNQLFGKIEQLKFLASDGKKYKSDAANTETLLRIIQAIPSPKAEPIKQWLASLGNQRVEEGNDPELGMQRARERAIHVYKSRWMTDTEIQQRLQNIDIRHDYTDELKARGIQGKEYGILTNTSYTRSGKDAENYKKHKGLTKHDNLRDHMTRTEMLLTGLSEEAGAQIAKSKNAQGFYEVQDALLQWADIAKNTRENLEKQTGESILSEDNRLSPRQQALRKKAHAQEKLWYNSKKK